MAQLEITTELDNRAFVPGDVVRGQVSWQSDPGASSPDAAELRLFYYTAGKGTRDVGIVETMPLDSPGPSGNREFEFTLPDGPYSFSGKLVSLIWALELQLGPGGPTERFEFTLSPTGEEINLYAHDDGNLPEDTGFGFRKNG